ncbi:histidine kinase [Nonomuraea sp. NPDC050310]|uniref:sensor histidine kinase n=1 Tax=Nonomuraea sp. NPDC050310 TaxID=3154935 RepID=UPI0034064D1A
MTRPEVARKILVYWMDGTVAFLGLLYLMSVLGAAMSGTISLAVAGVLTVCLAGVCVIFALVLRIAFAGRPRPTLLLAVMGVLAVTAVALVPPGGAAASGWDTIVLLWVSISGLFLHRGITAALAVAAVAGTTVRLHLVGGHDWLAQAIVLSIAMIAMTFGLWLWLWLWRTIREAYESKEAKARLAVTEERLRFSRDLHDLLGRSLVMLSLKSELAGKLGSAEEMRQVHRLAGEALSQLHATATGLRALDLDEELAEGRGVLESIGVRCTVETGAAAQLPPHSRDLLAWVVREGTTNILKHSTPTHCLIKLDGGVLEIRNDGVRPASDQHGSGLEGLAERLTTGGGSLRAEQVGETEFVLRAAVPA